MAGSGNPYDRSKYTSVDMPWATLVRQADPDRMKEDHKTVEYQFSNGRVFTGDPDKRGAYAPEDVEE